MDKKKAAEAAAVVASVRRLYRVREESGVEATRTPDIIAPAADLIEAGTAFYGKAEVCMCAWMRSGAVVCVVCVRVFCGAPLLWSRTGSTFSSCLPPVRAVLVACVSTLLLRLRAQSAS